MTTTESISPLAPKQQPILAAMDGLTFSTAAAGIKYSGRDDVLLVQFEHGARIAGVFTRSQCASAPVEWCQKYLSGGMARALLVNSGNANAFTGKKGWAAVELSAKLTADAVGCEIIEVFLASTGVIGEPLPAEKYSAVMGGLAKSGRGDDDAWQTAAKTIMTTDTYPKLSTRDFQLGSQIYQIGGMAKGSGMIQPDMATMLSFLFTNAPIPTAQLQKALSDNIGTTFNAITVDSDTSTSDTVLLFSLNASENASIADLNASDLENFEAALHATLKDLALQVVRDGEGARKLVEITVSGAVSDSSAKKIAFSIANSPLVKTAVAGEDANWGRVVMAVGKAGEPADRDKLSISFGDVRMAVDGEPDPNYSEEAASAVMKQQEIPILVDMGLGNGSATVWTCDLTKEYIAINGDYRS
ncbi:MAG: bifunctional ornithine acetyltransferase/N-acetylglutamate synthase [Hyphomicrobiales bacterium]|nr:MAG: bifunctional ornithine acetyltransferase/N-acetylglutamate synthase [Hyphomicrobiales bacterium]